MTTWGTTQQYTRGNEVCTLIGVVVRCSLFVVRCSLFSVRRSAFSVSYREAYMATLTNRAARWGSARLSRRLARSMPIVGAVIAAATVVATMRRKGFFGGAFDTGLNAMPGIGAAKNAIEVARGRDFFPDRVR